MEAATLTPEHAPETDATRSVAEMFRYSDYVHAGTGAEACEHGTDGTCCEDDTHFHAYVRLPNQFQQDDIRQRALAAKARRMRALRDPESDAYAILDADMLELERADDRQALIDELVSKDWWKRQLDAHKDVVERDEFEHIDRDRERLAEIDRLELEQRPDDERDELIRHITDFGMAVQNRVDELERPQRDALEGRSVTDLVGLVREDRIAAEASQAFMDTYSKWQAFVGTLAPVAHGRPSRRVYAEVKDLENEEPHIVNALREKFARLETALQRPNS